MPKRRPPSRNPVLERIIGLGIIGLIAAALIMLLNFFEVIKF